VEAKIKIIMMKKNLILCLIAALLFSSCSVNYYQVFKTQSKEKMLNNGSSLVYSDDNCTIYYDFWSDGGNIGFVIQNNSDKNIYLNKKECFFICNGYAYDYFKNRTYTNTVGVQVGEKTETSKAANISVSGENMLYGYKQTNSVAAAKSYAVSFATSSSSSISWEEFEIICIPPKTAKAISEFGKITNSIIRNCNLFRYPTDKQTNSSTFSEAESPLVFCNKLAYYLGDSKDLIRINNEFYVSEIKNLTEKNMVEIRTEDNVFCGEKIGTPYMKRYWKDATPDKFYIHYTKSSTPIRMF